VGRVEEKKARAWARQTLIKVFLGVSLLGLVLAWPAFPQSLLGSIGGAVTDPGGAPLPGARVLAVQEETNKTHTAETDARGRFLFPLLPPGTYRLEIQRSGYRNHVQVVELKINQGYWLDVALLPGSFTQEVEVVVSRPLLKTETAAISTVIDNLQITHLPLNGRNFAELSLLVPGTVRAAPGSAASVRGEVALNVNGGRDTSNQFLLDGVYNGDPTLNGVGVVPPVDAILEFELLTHSYEASFGRNAGGQVNVALKGGSNQFHGTLYEFFGYKALDARNTFAPAGEPQPKNTRNQFGFSLGGPLKKDRTFLFGDYEGRIVREGVTRIATVPSERERVGDFSESAGGIIPSNLLDPIGVAIAGLYPLPNRATEGGNFVASPTRRDDEHHFDLRLDQVLGELSDVTARYSFSDLDRFEPYSGPLFAAVPGFGADIARRAQNLMVSQTHAFSLSWLNEARFAFHRVDASTFHENSGTSINHAVGLPEPSSNPRDFGLSLIRVTGFSPLGDESNNPQDSTSNTIQLFDQATYVRGSQTYQFGFDFRAIRQNAFRDVQARGFLDFVGLSGSPLADLLLGLPALTGAARVDNPERLRSESYGFFFQHNNRLRSDLTLTLGLRYEYNSPPVDADDRATTFDPATQALVQVGSGGIPRSGYRADWNNWAPRIGLAWKPWGEGDTVVRAGYGIYYEQAALAPGEGLYFNPPFFEFSLFFPLPGQPLLLSDPFPSAFPFSLPSSALAYQRDLGTGYVQHWSFGVQQSLGASRVLEVGYVGSRGSNLLSARDINQPPPSRVVPNPRPLPQFDDINLIESRAQSRYNSLQVRFLQVHDFGLSMLSSYTWSKSIDDASSFFASAGDPNFPQDSFDLGAERARSNFDVRHRFTLSFGYDLPFGKGARWEPEPEWLSGLVGGWQTFGILVYQSGYPFTVSLLPEVDISNTGRSILGFGANDRPNLVGDPGLANASADQWFDTAAFSLPEFGTFGSAGRNILNGPDLRSLDFSLVKNMAVRDQQSLQFRVEFFNLFNHVNLDLPDHFLGSPTFGRVLSARNGRRIQFGLKFLF
jgi:hypothetical protein